MEDAGRVSDHIVGSGWAFVGRLLIWACRNHTHKRKRGSKASDTTHHTWLISRKLLLTPWNDTHLYHRRGSKGGVHCVCLHSLGGSLRSNMRSIAKWACLSPVGLKVSPIPPSLSPNTGETAGPGRPSLSGARTRPWRRIRARRAARPSTSSSSGSAFFGVCVCVSVCGYRRRGAALGLWEFWARGERNEGSE
jgi:hypothetical protein